MQADRTLNTGDFGTKRFWRGFQVGCYTCHNGPGGGDGSANLPALVSDTSASTAQDTPVVIPLQASDLDGNALTLRVVSQASGGTVALSGKTAQYFPEPGFSGSDSFTFAAWDGSTDSNLATVRISVSGAPPAGTSTATPTPSATGATTPTATRVVTTTATRTATVTVGGTTATATAIGSPVTPTETGTPSNSPALPCLGDCNGDGVVNIDELITGVNITLSLQPLSKCIAFDKVTMAAAVNAALDRCLAVATPTATVGESPIVVTATATPTESPTVALPTKSRTPTATATPPPASTHTSTPTSTTSLGSPTTTPTINSAATLSNIQAIFDTTCATIGCHSGMFPSNALNLESGMSYGQLVNEPAFNFPAQQAGLLRVKPGDPDNSFLIIKLTLTAPSNYGSPMPSGQPPLSPAQVQLIRDWITSGAPNN